MHTNSNLQARTVTPYMQQPSLPTFSKMPSHKTYKESHLRSNTLSKRDFHSHRVAPNTYTLELQNNHVLQVFQAD